MEHPLHRLVERFLDGRIDLPTLTAEAGMLLAKLRPEETEALRLAGSILGPIAEHSLGHRSNAELRTALEEVAAPVGTASSLDAER